MKILLVGINSKYIHPNLAIRYLKTNCDFDSEILEFTIKDSFDDILKNILDKNPDIIGFSVYIWNVDLIKQLTEKIKCIKPKTRIILGGPEVSYESEDFIKNNLADFIIVNEGEIAFNQLMHALIENSPFDNVQNLIYLNGDQITRTNTAEIQNLDALHNPYDIALENHHNQIAYVELSRGCPYNCSYCMASLEKRVRFFKLERIKNQIQHLYDSGSRTFKFLDRTFNVKEDIAKELLDFIFIKEFKDAIFQFEINADILSREFIDHINRTCPENKIRFEIGIQSTNQLVNDAVNRKQDIKRLIQNIKLLKQGNAILHLDLIAGLPYEDLTSFKRTFDTVFKLYGHELQLGFLKLLKGTKIYYEKEKYMYQVHDTAPYELICNQFLSKDDLEIIHLVEETLSIYWNKNFMDHAIQIISERNDSPFDFFNELGRHFLSKGLRFHRYQLTDIFIALEEFVTHKDFIYEIRYDYLKHSKIKPKIYWKQDILKNEVIRMFHSQNQEYNIDQLYKYSLVTEYNEDYLIALYYPDHQEFHIQKA